MRERSLRRLLLAAAVAAVASLALVGSASAANHAYKFSFGSATTVPVNPYPLDPGEGFRIAVDNSGGPSDGDIYALEANTDRVEKFDPQGHLLLMFGNEVNKTASQDPESTEVEENVCVIASGDVCQAGVPGDANDQVTRPRSIAIDNSDGPSSGDIYISDEACCLGSFVLKYDENGDQVKTWGEKEGKQRIFTANGLTVEIETGDLFVVGNGEMFRFDEDGHQLAHFVYPGSQGPAIGLDSNGVFAGHSEKIDEPHGLLKFSQSGSFIAQINKNTGNSLAIDTASNDLYTGYQGGVAQFDNFCGNNCTPIDEFGAAQSPGALAFGVTNEILYAASNNSEIAAFETLSPKVEDETFVGADETSADFSATLNPNGHGPITECELQYSAIQAPKFTGSAPCTPDPATEGSFATPTQVTAHVEGLPHDSAFHFRFVAHNAGAFVNGLDRPFRSAGAPRVSSFTSSHVTRTSAELSAKIIPGGAAATYRFEYGPTTSYGQSAPIPDGQLNEGLFTEQDVAAQIELDPGSRYHFRVVAENAYGTTVTADQTFGFYPPSCPNQAIRQQTGANDVPDCRGYELVTPAFSGNAVIFPAGSTPNLGRATAPSRLGYGAWGGIIPGIGANPPNVQGDQYIATRTASGWTSKFIGLPSSVARLSGGPPYRNEQTKNFEPDKFQNGVLADPAMNRIVDWNGGQFQTLDTQGEGEPLLGQGPGKFSSNAPYVWDGNTGKQLDRWPTNLGAVPGGDGFMGETIASADLNHFVFSSTVPFASGGMEGFPYEKGEGQPYEREYGIEGDVYDNDTTTGEVKIANRLNNGDSIAVAPARVSEDGSHILMSSPKPSCGGVPGASWSCHDPLEKPVHLYVRANGITTYEIAPGQLVHYVGMTDDMSKIYFTTAVSLLPEDTDTSSDIYMWSEAGETNGEPLTLVSVSDDETTGNSDGCNASWTSQCNVLPIDFAKYCVLQGGLGGNCVSDRSIASKSGDIYFFSAEKLDGSFGIQDASNLYRFHNGDVNFVATFSSAPVCTPVQGTPFCSESPIARMNISPDGAHVAFITTSQLTNYDNADHSVMYSYTPATGGIICDSCRPDGLPPTSETIGSQNGLFLTDDGRAFFSTREALVPQDTNQGTDIYEYTEGRPQLISSGTAAENESFGFTGIETFPGLDGVSADGTDVYFVTYDVLIGQDQNGEELKIYDARSNGGFPFVKPQPECGAADECHGAGSSAPVIPGNGTGSGLGDRGQAEKAQAKKKKAASKKAKAKKKKKRTKKHHEKRAGGRNNG